MAKINERKPSISVTFKPDQVAVWMCRKYLRHLLLGALCSCVFFNVALHAGAGLSIYCDSECLVASLQKPLLPSDIDVIMYIASNWVDTPFARGSYKGNFPIDNPPWGKLGHWGEGLYFLIKYFKDEQNPGYFVEIGAQDGEFMSYTLWLEQVKNFKGLLIEPNPYDYKKLRDKKRSAYSINACATPNLIHKKDTLWLRDTPPNLPPLLKRIQEGSNRLMQYVSDEDRELGREIKIQCFNALSMIVAALRTTQIDLLTVSTHGGELDILAFLPKTIQIRVLVIVTPLSTKEDMDELKSITENREMSEVFHKGNIHIFMPSTMVKIVTAAV